MTTDPTQPLNEEEEAPMLSEDQLEEYGYPESPNDKIHLLNLVTRGRPFILLTVMDEDEDGHPQVAVDASGLDLVAAYAITNETAGALSQQISQLRLER